MTSSTQANEIAALRQQLAERDQELAVKAAALAELRAQIDGFVTAQRLGRLAHWILELKTEKVFWSDEMYRLYGRDPQNPIKHLDELFQYIFPEDIPRINTNTAQAVANKERYDLEHRIVRSNGEVRFVHAQGEATYDAEGTPLRMFGVLHDITDFKNALEVQRKQEAQMLELQKQIIMSQEEALRELSTPLIPIADGIVAMPLIGTIDSRRAQQLMETLLDGISTHQADVAILDITGVKIVDTQVADALLRVAQAAKLLGSEVVLTGIGAEIAQTLTHLGAGLDGITTSSNLQAGIAFALKRRQL